MSYIKDISSLMFHQNTEWDYFGQTKESISKDGSLLRIITPLKVVWHICKTLFGGGGGGLKRNERIVISNDGSCWQTMKSLNNYVIFGWIINNLLLKVLGQVLFLT